MTSKGSNHIICLIKLVPKVMLFQATMLTIEHRKKDVEKLVMVLMKI
jgi:hypothetical protein